MKRILMIVRLAICFNLICNTLGAHGNYPVNNSSYRGELRKKTYKPKSHQVRGHYRKNGTPVRGHYRSRR